MTASTRQISRNRSRNHLNGRRQLAINWLPISPATHQVTTSSLSDRTLVQAVEREGAGWAREQITELGQFLGAEEAQRWGFEANEKQTRLTPHMHRFGNRRDEVVFHPFWHNLMRTSVANRLHCLPWEVDTALPPAALQLAGPGARCACGAHDADLPE